MLDESTFLKCTPNQVLFRTINGVNDLYEEKNFRFVTLSGKSKMADISFRDSRGLPNVEQIRRMRFFIWNTLVHLVLVKAEKLHAVSSHLQ